MDNTEQELIMGNLHTRTGSRSTRRARSSRMRRARSRSSLAWKVRPSNSCFSTRPSSQSSRTRTVEAAEEHLVEATEQAINLMRSVLENPEPIKNIHALLKAQQTFYAEASEALASVLGEVEEAGTQAEAEWRCVPPSFRCARRPCLVQELPTGS